MPDGFVAFYDRHYRLVLTVAQQRLGGLSDAEDVTAEVFRIAWAHYQESGEITLPWVYQALRNVIGSEYRRRSRAPIMLDDLRELDWIVAEHGAPHDGITMRRELAGLEEADREVLFMTYWEDLSTKEVAEILGCSTSAVRVRLFRARRRLAARLSNVEFASPASPGIDATHKEGEQ